MYPTVHRVTTITVGTPTSQTNTSGIVHLPFEVKKSKLSTRQVLACPVISQAHWFPAGHPATNHASDQPDEQRGNCAQGTVADGPRCFRFPASYVSAVFDLGRAVGIPLLVRCGIIERIGFVKGSCGRSRPRWTPGKAAVPTSQIG